MSGRVNLWGEEMHGDRLEWELEYDPGEILDDWRETTALLEGVAKLAEHSPNNAFVLAIGVVHWNAEQEVIFWEDKVRMQLEWNAKTKRLTAFGEVLRPLMERAGIASTWELVKRAGKGGEMYAEETLLRHMYGPPTKAAGAYADYLTGFDVALGLGDDQESNEKRSLLAYTLMWRKHPKSSERTGHVR
jgi:hypothetical protein